MKDGQIVQVAYVVRDLDASLKRHWEVFGIGPWDIYLFEVAKGSELPVSGQASHPQGAHRGDLAGAGAARGHAAGQWALHLR